MIAVQNRELFLSLYKISSNIINSKVEFPIKLVGAIVTGSFARKIDTLNILDNFE